MSTSEHITFIFREFHRDASRQIARKYVSLQRLAYTATGHTPAYDDRFSRDVSTSIRHYRIPDAPLRRAGAHTTAARAVLMTRSLSASIYG
jgi:hypothetical protein